MDVDNVHVKVGEDSPVKEAVFDPDSDRKTRQDLDNSNPDKKASCSSVEVMLDTELERSGVVNGPRSILWT